MVDNPITRKEKYLAKLTGSYTGNVPDPITRVEKYLYDLCQKGISGLTPEEIENAVNKYLKENPVQPGATEEQAQQIKKNTDDVASLKEDISNKITKFYASSQGETHLADSDDGKIMDMMVYGKSEQKQYSGKNLFDKSTSKSAWISDDGIYIEKGEIGENTDVVSTYIGVKENSTYIASFKTNYNTSLVYWCTYNALKTYFPESEETGMNAIDKLIQIAKNEIGYLEKASNSQLDSKTANAGENNYTKYWRDIKPDYQGQPWCAAFVSWCMMKAFGLDTAKKLLKHWPYVYCPTMADLFTLNSNPKVGDIVIFYRNGTFTHTGIVIKVSGDRFWTVEGNTSADSAIIANGGGVCQKSYYNSNLPGTKFCTPNYSLVKNTTSVSDSDVVKKQNTRAYIAQIKKDTKCYTKSNKNSSSKLFPKLKKGAVVEVMKYTETDSSGLKWYFIRIPHPTEGFVFEFVPKGTFTRITEISK